MVRRGASLSPRSGHEPENSPARGLLQPQPGGALHRRRWFLPRDWDSFLARAQHAGFRCGLARRCEREVTTGRVGQTLPALWLGGAAGDDAREKRLEPGAEFGPAEAERKKTKV